MRTALYFGNNEDACGTDMIQAWMLNPSPFSACVVWPQSVRKSAEQLPDETLTDLICVADGVAVAASILVVFSDWFVGDFDSWIFAAALREEPALATMESVQLNLQTENPDSLIAKIVCPHLVLLLQRVPVVLLLDLAPVA